MTYPSIAYEILLADVMKNGVHKEDRTGTGTTSVFGRQMRFDLSDGFPLVTTKRVFLRGVIEELLWFLRGESNVRSLQAVDVHIWDEWADENGDLGPVYGTQWRSWPTASFDDELGAYAGMESIDQIANVVEAIKKNPDGRRHIVTAWNPAEVDQMALPPCHLLFQFYVADGKLSCQLYQRSCDMFLGVPFNIASYALLTMMVAQQCDLELGEFVWTGGDVHVYDNHRKQVALQLSRSAYPMPEVRIRKAASIFEYTIADFELVNYQHHPAIKGAVAV